MWLSFTWIFGECNCSDDSDMRLFTVYFSRNLLPNTIQ